MEVSIESEVNYQDLVTKVFGGNGGNSFTERGVKKIAIRSGSAIDAIIINGEQFGGNGGKLSETITLAPDEYISRMEIRHGSRIDALEITTNRGQQIGGGGNGGLASVGANGTVNSGSGGGGGSSNASGAGGSGVVVVRYQFKV